jgi:hypothetical protein
VSECLVVNFSVGDRGVALVHGFDLVLVERLSSLVREDLLQFFLADLATILLIEHSKGANNGGFGVRSCQSFAEESEEYGEVDRSGRFLDHVVELLVAGDLTHHGVQVLQVSLVDDAILVLVHDAEGFLELIDGLLVELRGLRPRTFLGGRLLLSCLRHVDDKLGERWDKVSLFVLTLKD